ncbi:MAG TPA: AAA family ATPase, partial [Ornithinibacter sp.]|nr:AAA family ATPase [Ornithinibacter sp.]
MTGATGVRPGSVVGGSVPGGTLVCVGGAPGAGKTTVGAFVAAGGGLSLVDLDSVTTALVEAFAASLGTVADLDAPQFATLRDARYACLAEVASDNLRAGGSVVAVAPFTTEAADAVAWRERARTWGATRVVLCWLDVDPEEAAARAAARGLPRDLAKAGRTAGPGRAGGVGTASRVVDRGGIDVVSAAGGTSRETAERILSVLAALT